jgi:hypothetical protein
MELKKEWMSWLWNSVTVLMVDQRVGEMSSCRERRVEYRATGVPSARVVGLSGSFPEPERSSAPEKRVVSPSC